MHVMHAETGIFSAYSQCSVAPHGEYVIFKKCSDIFHYFEPGNPRQNKDLRLVVEDVLHRRDTIFDFAHLEDGRFVVLLQSSPENLVHLAEASINLQEELVRVSTMVKEDIEIRTKGGQSRLIRDECGPVLITFPNNFADESLQSRTVQLFHVGDYMERRVDIQRNVRIDRRVGVNELWCNPFISRNSIYFFNQLGSELLCISMIGDSPTSSSATTRSRFTARLLRTHSAAANEYNGERPSPRFFHRDTIVFDDFALVYFSQPINVGDKSRKGSSKKASNEEMKSLWKLKLNSLVWESIQPASTDLHLPTNRVSFKQSCRDATTIFLHGQCGRVACAQKQHFFELEVVERESPLSHSDTHRLTNQDTLPNTQKRPTVLRRFVKFASGRKQSNETAPCGKKTAATLASSQSKSASCHSLLALANRDTTKRDKRRSEDTQSHRLSIASEQVFAGPSSSSSSTMNLLNWSRQMALHDSDNNRLSEQLRYAKEMGYSDAEIWAALDLTNKNTQKAYSPFGSVSAMIDALEAAQKKCLHSSTSSLATSTARFNGSTTTLPVYLDGQKREEQAAAKIPSWISSSALSTSLHAPNRPSQTSSGVNRSMSFNDSLGLRRSLAQSMGSLVAQGRQQASSSGGRSSIQRLIDTFETENRRHFEEFQRINSELRRKLENSVHQEETLRDLLRLRQEKIRQQEILLKNQSDMEKRLEHANRRLQEMLKDIQLREAEILRHQGDYDALQRRHDAETRKAEEVKQTLNAEIGRLVREQERQEQLIRENEALRVELETKNSELRQLSAPNPQIVELNVKLEKLNADLSRLIAEKHELEENQAQGPVCGVCMDNRREVIFMPCLHFTCCKRCANSMDQCSICRLRIMGKIEFFQ